MLGNDNHNWAAIPERRTLTESIPRQALLAKLDRRAALTIVRAPNGYGKSSLIASWLRAHLASERILVWVSAPDPSSTIDDFWFSVLTRIHAAGIALPGTAGDRVDPFIAIDDALGKLNRPVLVVLIRPDLIPHPGLDDPIVELLTRCHNLDIIVTLSGLTLFPAPYLLDTDHVVATASELLFTATDTAHLLALSDVPVLAGDADRITASTGGIPALVRAATAAIKNLPAGGDRARLLERHLTRAVGKYTADHVLATADMLGQREFVLAIAFARMITVDIVAAVLNPLLPSRSHTSDALLSRAPLSLPPVPDLSETIEKTRARLVALESAGVLSRVESEPEDTWEFPPVIRRSILDLHTQSGIDTSQRLSFLAHNRLVSGRHESALDYAVEAQNWVLAADIVEHHWVSMIASGADALRSALQRIPPEATAHHPAVRVGRALLALIPIDIDINTVSSLPASPHELSAVGAGDGAKDALGIGCIQSIMLRLTGEYERSVTLTRGLSHLSGSALEHNPDAVAGQLPLMQVQWAMNYQLRGAFFESTIEARMAYQGGLGQNVDFLTRHAAGSIALNWAMVGEPLHALHWSDLEQRRAEPGGWSEKLVRTAGLVAQALVALDTLDFGAACATLNKLGHPSETEELWAFVTYAHSQNALAQGDIFAALSLLRRTAVTHSHQHTATSFSLPLMQATEIDLLLALGEANAAAAVAQKITDPAANPWTLTSVARLRQRIGHNESAVALCHHLDWAVESYPRAQMESLLVQAVAHLELGEPKLATQAWSKACSIADQTGLLRSFSTIAAADIDALDAAADTTSHALAEFRKISPAQSFPKSVPIVALTERERRVLALLGQGMTAAAMADTLFVSANTIKSQLRTLYRKLDAHNRHDAITRAHSLKLFRREEPPPPDLPTPQEIHHR